MVRFRRLLRCLGLRLVLVLVRWDVPVLAVAGVALVVGVLPHPKSVLRVLPVDLLAALVVIHDAHLNVAAAERILVLLFVFVLR